MLKRDIYISDYTTKYYSRVSQTAFYNDTVKHVQRIYIYVGILTISFIQREWHNVTWIIVEQEGYGSSTCNSCFPVNCIELFKITTCSI